MMPRLFDVNGDLFHAENSYVNNNSFIGREVDTLPPPAYDAEKLPKIIWDGREDVIACYNGTWQVAFRNIRTPNPGSGLISTFIHTAFNDNLFMWDSTFNVMYCKYASRAADLQRTFDNFYARQHKDGFICRELSEQEPGDRFSRDDPASTGPNIIPWGEWEHYLRNKDKERLAKVFDPLCGFYKWFMLNRSWPDGSYWSCGLGCGMDNQARLPEGYSRLVSHGFMSWIDTCAQQYLSANCLIEMAKVLGREEEIEWLKEDARRIYDVVNNKMWSDEDNFYHDMYRDGKLNRIKSIGAYWTLIAGLVPPERVDRFVAHLENEKEFKRPHRIPSISYDDPHYCPEGDYFNGSVWPQLNYMVLCGLRKYGYHDLAYEIACNHLDCVAQVYADTSAVYENYAPETVNPGKPALAGYVGWAGLGPIAGLIEYVFGIHAIPGERKIVWRVNCLDRHGVDNFPLGDATVRLICAKRESKDEPAQITVQADMPITVEVIQNGASRTIHYEP